ncbi:unnamed protein product [Oncorhynchus mykiss]|uniref:Uncharacterized protein n=1 Tax=Oncorhynchus mykiss TaxID=8022 RepID=A0A060XUI8_ONCMY|nr:unnamed protein product [Oncorhynchus mykiss]
MAANDYRGYLRNHSDTESAQPRYHASHGSEPTYRPLIFGTLAIMGFLQIASSVAILLHLTGYLQEVDISSAPQQPIEVSLPLSDHNNQPSHWSKEGFHCMLFCTSW